MLNLTPDAGMESIFETTSQIDVQTLTSVAPLPVSAPTITPSTIATVTTIQQTPTLPTTALSTLLQDLPNFGSQFRFDHRLKTLEANFFEFTQMNQFVGAVSSIPGIVHRYMDERMNESVKVAVQLQSYKLYEEAQKENDEFLKTINENMQKIIKEQVKEQVKVQVSKILSKIEQTVNEQLEAEVLTQSSNSSKTSYARSLYKALVEAYESDKIILDTYEDTVTLKRHRDDDADKDEDPPLDHTGDIGKRVGYSRGANTDADDQPIVEPSQHPEWFSQQKKPPTLDRDWNKTFSATHGSIQPWISDLAKLGHAKAWWSSNFLEEVYKARTDQLDWVNPEGQQYPHNLLKPLPLILNNQGRRVIPFDHFINNDLKYLRGGALSRKYTTSVTKIKAADYGHIKWIKDSITVRRDDDKLYKFKEGEFKRLCIQDIEDMLLLLVQRKLTNLTVEERFAFNISLRMFTRSIIIQRRVEDLQLGLESYQKKLNLTKLDTYRSDLKRKEAYIAYSNPRGFIYQNKDKPNWLMQIDELHKFSDGMLTNVRTALDDRLKGIQMKYLPQSIWRKNEKDRVAAMIQAIDNRLKTRRIMRSLERFFGRRLYEGDFQMLQRTI
nr:hypothetical protein [Tanacetum cinerariifolium]